MAGTAVVQPQLYAADGRAAVAFYVEAFGATVLHQVGGTDDDPPIVAQLAVGDGAFWVTSESASMGRLSPLTAGSSSCRLLLVVDDPQAVLDSAIAAGATLLGCSRGGARLGDRARHRSGRIRVGDRSSDRRLAAT